MSNIKVQLGENECSHQCQSTQHGAAVASTISLRGINSLATISYLHWLCSNCGQVVDREGRSGLHLAASCGQRDVACWLVRHGDASVNLKDLESGYTPLHRSVYYGQIHVAANLIQLGSSMSSVDNDELTALDHAMKDRMPYVEYSLHHPCEVYTWGTNNNYTLGIGNQHGRPSPELLDCFRKQNMSIRQVAMQKFHSVFVTNDGRVFSCGHGQGGRLGLGNEQATLVPVQMKVIALTNGSETQIAAASVGRDHTVLLTENKVVMTCGLNTYHQLGHFPPPPFLLTPRPLGQKVLRGVGIVEGVCGARFHTVIWGPKGIVTCGLNAGQLGHAKAAENTQTTPRQVPATCFKECEIIDVAASDGATVLVTTKGDIYALHEYQCRKIASRQLNVMKVVVVGGHLDSRVDTNILRDGGGDKLKIAALTKSGKLFLWQESTQQLMRCMFSLNRSLIVSDVALCRTNLLLLATQDGEAFEGEMKPRKIRKPGATPPASSSTGTFHEFLDKYECEQVRLKRLPHIHRAVRVICDPKGRNFAVLQTHPKASLLEIPTVESSDMHNQMKALLQDANTQDVIHDVVFLVEGREFPAHRFVVASRSEFLAKLIQDRQVAPDEVPRVKVSNIKPDIFEKILLFIYTNESSFLEPQARLQVSAESKENIDLHNVSAYQLYCDESANKKDSNKSKATQKKTQRDAFKFWKDIAKRFGLTGLQQKIQSLEEGNCAVKDKITKVCFNIQDHQDLCDVAVMSEDGQEIKAHKCIVSARLEYFNSMLNHGWLKPSQSSKLRLQIPYKILELLLAFLYEDDSKVLQESDDLDFMCNVLIVADQLFVTRLKEICEVTLTELITLRNAGQILQFADTYNAAQLKKCCMEYICLNLSAALETRVLEGISDLVLEQLSQYYREFNPCMSQRTITPYSDAPNQSLIEAVGETYPVSVQEDEDADIIYGNIKRITKPVKKKQRIRKTSINEPNKSNERNRNESISSNHSITSDEGEGKKCLNFGELIEQPGVEDVTLNLCNLSVGTSEVTPPASASWVKVTNSNSKQHKVLQARMKAIAKGKELQGSDMQENFTTLVRRAQQTSPKATPPKTDAAAVTVSFPSAPASPPPDLILDFPELNSTPRHHESHPKTGHKSSETKKVSQKQKKKVASKGTKAQKQAWAIPGDEGNNSLADIMREEAKGHRQASTPIPVLPFPAASSSKQQSPPTMNPWQKYQPSPVGSPDVNVKFCDIVADEKKQRENWTKMRAKPLELTQMEDKAIEDLLLFYNASGVSDERITVQRVITDIVAPPTWITSHH